EPLRRQVAEKARAVDPRPDDEHVECAACLHRRHSFAHAAGKGGGACRVRIHVLLPIFTISRLTPASFRRALTASSTRSVVRTTSKATRSPRTLRATLPNFEESTSRILRLDEAIIACLTLVAWASWMKAVPPSMAEAEQKRTFA